MVRNNTNLKATVWEGAYFDAYDKVLLNSDIYLAVRNFHLRSLAPCQRVLDSGAGTGNMTVELLARGKCVVAADLSWKGLQILERRTQEARQKLEIVHLSADRLPFRDRVFDGINSMFMAHFVEDIEGFLAEHYRVLEAGGVFALTWRQCGENMEKVLASYESSLARRGLLEELATEMAIVRDKFDKVSSAVIHNYSIGKMQETLLELGFSKVVLANALYLGQCHSLLAWK